MGVLVDKYNSKPSILRLPAQLLPPNLLILPTDNENDERN